VGSVMASQSPYPTIYNRIVDYAVKMLLEHPKWTPEHAIGKTAENNRLFAAYLKSFKKSEVDELCKRIKKSRLR
jgi:hypothetical protein